MTDGGEKFRTLSTPGSSLPTTAGNPPAAASPGAGISVSSPPGEKAQGAKPRRNRLERRAISIFLSQDEAGRKLGHSGAWLGREAARHDLYKPTVGGGRQGSICLYHPDHIDHIVKCLMVRDLVTEDTALRAWNEKRQAIASDIVAVLRAPAPRRGRNSGKAGR